jgi:hypothetical protein
MANRNRTTIMGQRQSEVERMDMAAATMPNVGSTGVTSASIERQIAAVQSQPSTNPWAHVSMRDIGGADARVVSFNTIKDGSGRGEPSSIKNHLNYSVPTFLENPRASDAQLDKVDIKNLQAPRPIENI